MQNQNPERSQSAARAQRPRRVLFAVLLGLTLCGGIALERGAHAAFPSNPPAPAARVTAHGSGPVTLHGQLDRTSVLQGGDGLVRLELALRAADDISDASMPRRATDLVVVLDRSGSMQGQKIASARAAVQQLISELGAEDRFSLVAFSSSAEALIPLSYATPAARASWHHVVSGLRAGGGTYMGPALDLGLGAIERARAAERSPRVVLISDGLAAEPHAVLQAQAARAARGEYALSTVGVGADFDESLLGAMADAGTGNFYYLDNLQTLAGVFRSEFETARETVATGLRVALRPADGVTVVEAAGYPLVHEGGEVVFRPGGLFAGQERRVWVTLRVPTDAGEPASLGNVAVSYRAGESSHELSLADLPQIARVAQQRDYLAGIDSDGWARSVAVEEYNGLRQQVAELVKNGRQDEALDAIGQFQDRNVALNAAVAAPSVDAKLEESRELEESVRGAFEGSDTAQKQNLLGKSLYSSGAEARRAGSRKQIPNP